MEQTCGRGLSVLGGGKFGAALGVVLTVIVDAGNKQQHGQLSDEKLYWLEGGLFGACLSFGGELEGSWRGAGGARAGAGDQREMLTRVVCAGGSVAANAGAGSG